MVTRRFADASAERVVAKYLDYFFYGRLAKPPFHMTSRRTITAQEQRSGCDVVLHSTTQTYLIDEKAQVYYINQSLPTFAFEVDSIQTGGLRIGWLLNDE